MLNDLLSSANTLKNTLEPIGNSIKDIGEGIKNTLGTMFESFLSSLQQQQQQSSIMDFLPLIGGATVLALVIFKKKIIN